MPNQNNAVAQTVPSFDMDVVTADNVVVAPKHKKAANMDVAATDGADMMMGALIVADGPSFADFNLPKALASSLEHMKYTAPTPIQQQAIPAVIKGKDLLASAQTGTGKTGAFIIPILAKLMLDPHAHAIIMAPTRELAAQILAVAHQMAHGHVAIKTALLIGGESMGRQRAQLSARPRMIVGTPGRMNDHLRSNPRMYMQTTMLVLDEADRMLDMGFAPQIKEIIQTTNPKRQTLMFSATFPENIMKFAQQYLNDPVRISIEPERTSAACIKHELLNTTEGARYNDLARELGNREGSVILFIKTKHGADRMAKRLSDDGHSVDVLHGGLNQRQRDRAIAGFRSKKTRVMVATDVAARGLDVPHIEHVINYDLPQVPEDYVHRIGRTGRNGKEGTALSFVMPSEMGKWRAIQRILNPNAAPHDREGGANRGGGRGGARNSGPRRGSGEFRPRREEGNQSGGRYDRPARNDYNNAPRQNSGYTPRMDDMSVDSTSAADHQRNYDERPAKTRGEYNKPRGAFQPRGEFKPRTEGGFKPRGDFQPRGDRGDFKPRGEFKPRSENGGFKPRGDFQSRGPRPEGNFKPREEGNFNADAPRGEYKPRGEFQPRGEYKPRGPRPEGDFKPRGEFKPRSENGGFKPRGDAPTGDKPRGDKPFKKPYFAKKAGGGKPFGGKSFGDRKPRA